MKNISSIVNEVRTPECLLRLSVSITIVDRNNKYHMTAYKNEIGEFITFDMKPRLVLRMYLKNSPWTAKHQFVVNQRYFEIFKSVIKEFYDGVINGNNFIYDDRNILSDVVKDETDVKGLKTENQSIKFEPDYILNSNGSKIPGVRITINEPHITETFSFDEFELIYNEIESMSLYDKGMDLLAVYTASTEIPTETIMKEYRELVQQKNEVRHKNIFDRTSDEKNNEVEGVVSGVIRRPTPNSIYDI